MRERRDLVRCPGWKQLAKLLGCAVTAGAMGMCGVEQTQAGEPAGICTSARTFAIPFDIDAAKFASIDGSHLELFVSTDGALTWHSRATAQPEEARFVFRADGEGTYQFCVRMVDGEGRLHPSEEMTADQTVHLDQTKPTLTLALERTAEDRVKLSWQAEDAHLDSGSMALEWTSSEEAAWQEVFVQASPAGRTSWSVHPHEPVRVRGKIADLAGNVAEASAQTEGLIIQTSGVSEVETFEDVATIEIPTESSLSGPVLPAVPAAKEVAAALREQIAQERFQERVEKEEPKSLPALTLPGLAGEGVGAAELAGQMHRLMRHDSDMPDRNAAANQPTEPARLLSAPPAAATPSLPNVRPAEAYPPRQAQAPPLWAEDFRVNSLTFAVAYEVTDVGPSGVGAVDLYITEDRGRSWFHYGQDADRQSPVDVSVPGEGTYGFTVRVRSGVGLTDPPPQPGEAPAITVGVDRTAPRAELSPLEQGQGAGWRQVGIRWRITEAKPHAEPVALSYSANLDGPWEPITTWQPDRGEYEWTIDRNLPPRIYVRLDVRDAAGNRAQVVSQQPLVIDFAKPQARILTVQPRSETLR